jgi:hypothetical protein
MIVPVSPGIEGDSMMVVMIVTLPYRVVVVKGCGLSMITVPVSPSLTGATVIVVAKVTLPNRVVVV